MKRTTLMAVTLLPTLTGGLILTNLAQASPRPYNEARAAAMGYTGTAAARSVGALLHNPALLAAPHGEHQDDWGLMLPSLGLEVVVDEELIDLVDEFQDNKYWDNLQGSINQLNQINNGSDVESIRTALRDVADDAAIVNRKLLELDNSAAVGNVGGAIGFANPGPTLGFGLHVNGSASFFAIGEYRDGTEINRIVDEVETLLAIENPTIDDIDGDLITAIATDDPSSEGQIVGLAVSEIGVSLARQFELGGTPLQVGITPKYQEIRTFYYLANFESFERDDFDEAEQETSDSGFNIDLGVATQFGETRALTVGLMARNLIGREVDTVQALNSRGNRQSLVFELEPSFTLGVSYDPGSYTLTADLDLTETKATAFEGDHQMIALGGEVDLGHWVQLRGGVRHNLASNPQSEDIDDPTLFTAGLGFTPGAFYLDVSGGISDKQYAASLEMGLVY